MDIQSNTHEQRTTVRVPMPATATIDSYSYKVENWSLGGLQISGFKETAKVGDCLPVQLYSVDRKLVRKGVGSRLEPN